MPRSFLFAFALSLAAVGAPVLAVTPMDYYHALVAGGRFSGFKDGPFSEARFNEPTGLAFNDAGTQLYVADSSNHRIRVVDLGQDNDVKTLAGSATIGGADGPVSTATFYAPEQLATLSQNRLAVFDGGNHSIRLIDLQSQSVTTVLKNADLRAMVYRAQDDSLYFSTQDNKVERLDMKSLALSTVLANSPQVPAPGALCLYKDHFCVADLNLPMIYEMTTDDSHPSTVASPTLALIGNAQDVLALGASDDTVYALDKRGLLLKAGLPDFHIVKTQTPWGFLFTNQDYKREVPLYYVRGALPAGFLASPTESRKFYVAAEHSIVSVTDYDFEKWWSTFQDNDKGLTDFDYPLKKPARTFRILVTGASRNSTAYPAPSSPLEDMNEDIQAPKAFTYTKKLELGLNTEAALRGLSTHFEVLNLTRRGDSISLFGYYEIPDYVKKYDIDLVLALADITNYKNYYQRPLTPEGIPSRSEDHDYSMKPLSERAKSGPAADMLRRCKELKIPVSEKQDFPGDGSWGLFCNGNASQDPEILRALGQMMGHPLHLLQDKLNSMKTTGGAAPQLVLFFLPGCTVPDDCAESFWGGVCSQFQLKFLDLSDGFNALRISYAPTFYVNHFTSYGNEMVALLLQHYLIEDKLIPFEPTPTPAPQPAKK